MKIRNLQHSCYKHMYHIVWGTKYRRKILKPYVTQVLEKIIREFEQDHPSIFVHTFNTDEDHIHLQIEIPPNLTVAEVVQKLKKDSSKLIRREFKFIKKMYLKNEGMWSVEYFSSTNGLNEAQVQKYIEQQGEQDAPQAQESFEF